MLERVTTLGIQFLPDAAKAETTLRPIPNIQSDTIPFAPLVLDQSDKVAIRSILKEETGSPDPVASAKQAWQKKRLWQEALRITHFPKPVPHSDFKGVLAWEEGWREYAGAHTVEMVTPEQRQTVQNSIAAKFSEEFMERSPLAPAEVLEKCTDAEFKALHSAALLIDFFKFKRVYFAGTLITDFLEHNAYNCASISLISLHLLQHVGVTAFECQSIPGHAMLALRLSCGLTLYLNDGKEFLPPGAFDYSKDVTGYNRISHEFPKPAYTSLEWIYSNSGAVRGASEVISEMWYYASGLLISPSSVAALHNMGNAYYFVSLPAMAKMFYSVASEAYPFYVPPRVDLGLTFADEGQMEEAWKHIRQAVDLETNEDDKFSIWMRVGEDMEMLEKFADAILGYKETLKIYPQRHYAHKRLGMCFYKLNNFEAAIEQFLICLKDSSWDHDLLNNLGVLFDEIGDIDQAREYFRRAMELQPNNDLYAENYRSLEMSTSKE